MIDILKKLVLAAVVLLMAGCAVQKSNYDYSHFREENPRSILVVPVVNHSVNVDAPDYLLSSLAVPVVERGYYVFPVNMVKQVMSDDGLSDADMVHSSDPVRLAKLFGADSVLYVDIERWDAQYVVLSTTVTVNVKYTLKSGKTGETLWENSQAVQYVPQNSGGGLVGAIITAALAKAAPNYMPLARQANGLAVYTPGHGLPAGPYDGLYGKDKDKF
jgi:hypothetical protein